MQAQAEELQPVQDSNKRAQQRLALEEEQNAVQVSWAAVWGGNRCGGTEVWTATARPLLPAAARPIQDVLRRCRCVLCLLAL